MRDTSRTRLPLPTGRVQHGVIWFRARESCVMPDKKPIWIIAHRCNDENDVPVALTEGANSIECDVMSDGERFVVKHDGSVDFHVPSLPTYLKALMRHKSRVRLLYIDYKGPSFSRRAGASMVAQLREAKIPDSGIRVVFSIAKYENRKVFGDVPKESWIAPQLDYSNSPAEVAAFFTNSGFTHAWYGDGISNLWWEPKSVGRNIKKAIALRDKGSVIRGVVVWTLDDQGPMRNYLKLGVDAILTHDPEDVVTVLHEPAFKQLRKAPGSDAPW
jgi:glycerophosphoryl diester phosphodiesterase